MMICTNLEQISLIDEQLRQIAIDLGKLLENRITKGKSFGFYARLLAIRAQKLSTERTLLITPETAEYLEKTVNKPLDKVEKSSTIESRKDSQNQLKTTTVKQLIKRLKRVKRG